MKYTYRTRGVCPSEISFDIESGIIHNVKFTGGCKGNLSAISKLVEGMTVQKVIEILSGNTCGSNSTSCADQLAHAINEAIAV